MKEAKRDYVGVLTLLVHINVITLVTDDCWDQFKPGFDKLLRL